MKAELSLRHYTRFSIDKLTIAKSFEHTSA